MAKELPYFKFNAGKWIAGDITLCSMEAQGVFINMLSHYWNKGCSMSLANAKQRFSKYEASLDELLYQKIILLDEDENIIVDFLDEQMNEFINVSEKRALAGAKGGKAKAKQVLSKPLAKPSNIEKRREEKSIVSLQSFFLKEVQKFEDRYPKEMLVAFYNYWSEPNKANTKMRKDLEKTWDTTRRLITWYNRSHFTNHKKVNHDSDFD